MPGIPYSAKSPSSDGTNWKLVVNVDDRTVLLAVATSVLFVMTVILVVAVCSCCDRDDKKKKKAEERVRCDYVFMELLWLGWITE